MKQVLGLSALRILAVMPQFVLRLMARACAWLIWRANGRLRTVTEHNLAISFPNKSGDERIRIARLSLYDLCLRILELGHTWRWEFERLEAKVTRVTGLELLRDAVADNSGTLLIMPHLGNWELANVILGKEFSLIAMYRPQKSRVFDEIINLARARRGTKMVPTNSSGVRTLLKALRSGATVIVLPDQVPPKAHGAFAPFFDEMALTMTLTTNLISRTGARSLACYCKRLADDNFELIVRPADNRIYDSDRDTAMAGLNKTIEDCVTDCPEQYQWEYKRYKYLPNWQVRHYGN